MRLPICRQLIQSTIRLETTFGSARSNRVILLSEVPGLIPRGVVCSRDQSPWSRDLANSDGLGAAGAWGHHQAPRLAGAAWGVRRWEDEVASVRSWTAGV